MGYAADHLSDFRKPFLSRVWRYLAHIVIVCLSPRKGGYDAASHTTVSLMLALVYNKPYNFSGYIFGNLVENVRAGKDKWLLYPRFLQLILNDMDLGIAPDEDSELDTMPMLLRVFKDCEVPPKDSEKLQDRELFGHIVDVNYAPPPNDGFEDAVQPPVNEADLVDADVAQEMEDIENVERVDVEESDGGTTPADSKGDVPPQEALDAIQLVNSRRFKRILRRISEGRVHVPKNTGKRPAGSSPSYADLPLRRRQRRGSGIEI